jgi:hypothetical protein
VPAQLAFFEAVSQIIPVLLLSVAIGGKFLNRVLITGPVMLGLSSLVLAEAASLYALATGRPGVFATWLATVSLAGGVFAIGVEALTPPFTAMMRELPDDRDEARALVRAWPGMRILSWVGAMAVGLATFVILPVVVVTAITVAAALSR